MDFYYLMIHYVDYYVLLSSFVCSRLGLQDRLDVHHLDVIKGKNDANDIKKKKKNPSLQWHIS